MYPYLKKAVLFFTIILVSATSILAQPAIQSFSPTSAYAGAVINIQGKGFAPAPLDNIVFFGAVKASVKTASTNMLTVEVPKGASYAPITVTVQGKTAYSAKSFVLSFPGGTGIYGIPGEANDSRVNTFLPRQNFTTGFYPLDGTISDLDGDGRPEIITVSSYPNGGNPTSFTVLKNVSNPKEVAFLEKKEFLSGEMTHAVAVGDLNGDGKPDVITSSVIEANISVHQNTSTQSSLSFAPRINYNSGDVGSFIIVNDLDQDGLPDVIVVCTGSNSIYIYKNTSTRDRISLVQKAVLTTGLRPVAAVVEDMDGDLRPDIVVANDLSNDVSIFRNISNSENISFTVRKDFNSGSRPHGIATGDLDGDGKSDICLIHKESNTLAVYRNTSNLGDITFSPRQEYQSGADPRNIAIADFTGDGKPDIFVSSYNNTVHQTISIAGDIFFADHFFMWLGVDFMDVIAGDIDGDGKSDLVGTNYSSESVSILRNRNNEPAIGAFTPKVAGIGELITIQGSGFIGTTEVLIGGTPATSFSIDNARVIHARVPQTSSGSIEVINAYGSGTRGGYIYPAAPILDSFTPSAAAEGQAVYIYGKNFTTAKSVWFGNVAAKEFSVIASDTIVAIVGNGASGEIVVSNDFGEARKPGFTILPALNSFSPTAAGPGQIVTIRGSNLDLVTNVFFGGIEAASFVIESATQIKATVGDGASGSITLKAPKGVYSMMGFTYLPAPEIESFFPKMAGLDSVITIKGKHFRDISSVLIGGLPARSYEVRSDTIILAKLRDSAVNDTITISTIAGTGKSTGFIYIYPPVINSITPTFAGQGSLITIKGSRMATTHSVSLSNVTIEKFTVYGDTMLTVALGSGLDGISFINFRTLGGVASRYENQGDHIRYSSLPIIHRMSSTVGRSGESLVLYGVNFSGNLSQTAAYFGGRKAEIISVNERWIEVKIPPGAGYDIITVTIKGNTIYAPQPFTTLVSKNINYNEELKSAFELNTTGGYVIADFDEDGMSDMVVIHPSVHTMSIYRNKSKPGVLDLKLQNVIDLVSVTNEAQTLMPGICDVDGDGRLDIIVFGKDKYDVTEDVKVFRNISRNDSIVFERLKGSSGYSMSGSLIIRDIDMNGKPDLLVATPHNSHGPILYFNRGNISGQPYDSASLIYYQQVGGAAAGAAWRDLNIDVGDLDGDGWPDMVNGYMETSPGYPVTIRKNYMGSLYARPYKNIDTYPYKSGMLRLVDINNDGLLDIFAEKFVLINKGNLDFSLHHVGIGTGTPYDFNGDGKVDILSMYDEVSKLYLNKSTDGTISFDPPIILSNNPDYVHLYNSPFDFDQDGIPEIITAKKGSGNNLTILKAGISDKQPVITSISPLSGTKTTTVTIKGQNLSDIVSVRIGGKEVQSFTIQADTIITAHIGEVASGDVVVSSNYYNASKPRFTFIVPAPVITEVDPLITGRDRLVTIVGKNFYEVEAVLFGGSNARYFIVVDSATIQAYVGVGASGTVKVVNTGGVASFDAIRVLRNPSIYSFTPSSAGTNQIMTITGRDFEYIESITIGGKPVKSFVVNSPASITAIIGYGASGEVKVQALGGFSTRAGFTYLPLPVIESFSPSIAGAGDTIKIIGVNLKNLTSVHFGGMAASFFEAISDTLIRAVVAINSTSGIIAVKTAQGEGAKDGFVFAPPPNIVSFTPTSAQKGSLVTINGANFVNVKAVSFGGIPASAFSVVSPTQIQAEIGAGASGAVKVNTIGGEASMDGFIFLVDDPEGSPALQAYPNPTSGIVLIRHPMRLTKTSITVLDNTGTIIKRIEINGNTNATEINLSGLPAGIYSVLWSDGEIKRTTKVMLK